jgi:hypothetical protein
MNTQVATRLPSKSEWAELYEALSKLPKSKYAIPTSEIISDFLADKIHGDLLFVEVREYKKTPYLRKLSGSIGYFTRIKPNALDTLAFVRILASDPHKYARIFGEHYRCCAKCGAELTDERSRELSLGPECRKAFGYTK